MAQTNESLLLLIGLHGNNLLAGLYIPRWNLVLAACCLADAALEESIYCCITLQDAVAVWKTLYAEEKPPLVLVGHSMGGAIAVRTAATKVSHAKQRSCCLQQCCA